MSKNIFKYIKEKEQINRKIEATSENKEIMPKEVDIGLTKEIEKINRLSNQEGDYLIKKVLIIYQKKMKVIVVS